MIKEVYWGFEARRMRLDRILLCGEDFKDVSMEVVLNKPIY